MQRPLLPAGLKRVIQGLSQRERAFSAFPAHRRVNQPNAAIKPLLLPAGCIRKPAESAINHPSRPVPRAMGNGIKHWEWRNNLKLPRLDNTDNFTTIKALGSVAKGFLIYRRTNLRNPK